MNDHDLYMYTRIDHPSAVELFVTHNPQLCLVFFVRLVYLVTM